MARPRIYFTLIVDGPPGGCRSRLLQTLEEAGYTVGVVKSLAPNKIEVRVFVPYGEVNLGESASRR